MDKVVFLALLACTSIQVVFAGEETATASPQTLFVLANEDYRKAFDAATSEEHNRLLLEAVNSYQKVVQVMPSAPAYHNLGNALFRLGRIGESIFAYRKAILLAGRNPDTAANLDYMRTKCTGTPEPPAPGPLAKALLFWYYDTSLQGLEMSAALLWVLASALVLVWIWQGSRRWATAAVLCTVLAVGTGLGYLVRTSEWRHPSVVVSKTETRALSEARPTATALFTLGEGSEVRAGRDRQGWVEVLLPDGRRGWVAEDGILR
jgi:hypothetical protein